MTFPLSPTACSHRRISRAFENALCLPLHSCSKYILLSDCHRGVGNANDNFLNNEYLYLALCNITIAGDSPVWNWETGTNCGKTVPYRRSRKSIPAVLNFLPVSMLPGGCMQSMEIMT